MGLSISQTFARIGIQTTPSSLDIQSRNAQLELHQKQAKVNIHTEQPRIEIDQYECFASAGLKANGDLLKEASGLGYQQVMEFIAKKAADGDQMAAIESRSDPIPGIAKRDAYPTHEFNIDYIPKVGPTITVKGSIEFEPERNSEGSNNGVEGSFTPGQVNMNFNPSKVNISLTQYASIQFKYQPGSNIDYQV